VIVRLGGEDTAGEPWRREVRSVEQAIASALAGEGEYTTEGFQFLGTVLPRERQVSGADVFAMIDRVIQRAAGFDEALISELIEDRYFILMPTGTESDPSWDAWPVADTTRPEAGTRFAAVREVERTFAELEGDWGTGESDDPLPEYTDQLREFAFFADEETAIQSRAKRSYRPKRDEGVLRGDRW